MIIINNNSQLQKQQLVPLAKVRKFKSKLFWSIFMYITGKGVAS